MAAHTQGLMDLGATFVRGKPACDKCPVADTCVARREAARPSCHAARKAVPERETAMLVLQCNGASAQQARAGMGLPRPNDATGDPGGVPELGLERHSARRVLAYLHALPAAYPAGVEVRSARCAKAARRRAGAGR